MCLFLDVDIIVHVILSAKGNHQLRDGEWKWTKSKWTISIHVYSTLFLSRFSSSNISRFYAISIQGKIIPFWAIFALVPSYNFCLFCFHASFVIDETINTNSIFVIFLWICRKRERERGTEIHEMITTKRFGIQCKNHFTANKQRTYA